MAYRLGLLLVQPQTRSADSKYGTLSGPTLGKTTDQICGLKIWHIVWAYSWYNHRPDLRTQNMAHCLDLLLVKPQTRSANRKYGTLSGPTLGTTTDQICGLKIWHIVWTYFWYNHRPDLRTQNMAHCLGLLLVKPQTRSADSKYGTLSGPTLGKTTDQICGLKIWHIVWAYSFLIKYKNL